MRFATSDKSIGGSGFLSGRHSTNLVDGEERGIGTETAINPSFDRVSESEGTWET